MNGRRKRGSSSSGDSLTCKVALGAPGKAHAAGMSFAHPLALSVTFADSHGDAVVSDSASFRIISGLAVVSLTPARVFPGAKLTIDGAGFFGDGGSDASGATVHIGNASCAVGGGGSYQPP